jgi:hypothetical protein
MTFGRLRSYAHRLILKLDPDAARKRKEAARQDAHVRRFWEDSGNAGMVAPELPPDEVLASWHVEQRALDLRAAGMPGTLRELRVQAYLDLPAPRGAVPYRPRSGQGREEWSLDLMADLDLKGEGDSSMPGNRQPGPGVWGGVPGDPRDMAKAGLP